MEYMLLYDEIIKIPRIHRGGFYSGTCTGNPVSLPIHGGAAGSISLHLLGIVANQPPTHAVLFFKQDQRKLMERLNPSIQNVSNNPCLFWMVPKATFQSRLTRYPV